MNNNTTTTLFLNGKYYIVNLSNKKKTNRKIYIKSFPNLPKEVKQTMKNLLVKTYKNPLVFVS
jgi:hypothetical protein